MQRLLMPLLLLLTFLPSPIVAQNTATLENMQILIEKVRADKKLLVAVNMDLSDEESQGFWLVYDAYQRDLQTVNQRLLSAILNYADAHSQGSVGDAQAQLLINEAIQIQKFEADMLDVYAVRLSAVLPAAKIARNLQIENKIRAALRFGIAENIPLIN